MKQIVEADLNQQATLLTRPDWRLELQQAFRSPNELLEYVGLDASQFFEDSRARELFPLLVPRPFARLIKPGDANDPLLRQVLPLKQEFDDTPGYTADPLLEQGDNVAVDKNQGLLHKYQSRILIILKGGCAVNCRYCFRRHFPYQEIRFSQHELSQTIDYLTRNPQVNEVILSGGDPLMASDKTLTRIIDALSNVTQLKRLRIHSRLPIVIPTRITETLVGILANTRLKTSLVLHANHANEISAELKHRLASLYKAGIHLFNQSVLLKGVNDNVDSLTELSESLFDCDVLPYYLHQLDKVTGAAHFEVSDDTAQQLWLGMNERLPGFLVPKLVREVGGENSKTAIMPDGRFK